MENFSQITGSLAVVAYALAALVMLRARRNNGVAISSAAYRSFAVVAVILHAVSIYSVIVTEAGLKIGFFPALSLTSLIIVSVLIVISIWQPLEILGVVLFPIAGLCSVGGAYASSGSSVTEMELQWHILASVMAYSLLVLAAAQSVALAIQTHHLRTLHQPGMLANLPPIDLMEKLLFQLVAAGFVLLSISLLTGVLFLEDIFAQHLVHKTSLSVMAWLMFGTLLLGRWLKGWRGKTALLWTIGGLGFLIVGYFGSKLVLEFILAP
jgi:ABC-type uncharacterized transport system permease subunit